MKLFQLQTKLKESLAERIKYAQMDTRTYLWAKSNPSFDPEIKPEKGGGNFVIGLASLVLLENVAATYAALTKPEFLYQNEDLESWVKTKTDKKLSGKDLRALNCKKPKLYSIRDAGKCVHLLCKALDENNIATIGLPPDYPSSCRVWSNLRNGLAHAFAPKGASASGIKFHLCKEEEQSISLLENESTPPIHIDENGLWTIWGEVLIIRDLPKIYVFLEGIIDNQTNQKGLEIALKNISLP